MNNNNLVKRCRVCGDEALCFNFNGLSCEACKVFFRRNSFKELEYRNSRTCKIDLTNRKFCKRCRMDKCLAIGMKKENVLHYYDKILQKNNNTIPNAITDLNHLLPYDLYRVNELQTAMSIFPPEESMTCQGYTNDIVVVINTSEYYIPNAIKFCKQIGWFKAFNSADQYALLRSFFSEFTSTYAAFNFNVEENYVPGVVDGSKKEIIKFNIFSAKHTTKRDNAIAFRNFMLKMKSALENDYVIRNLVISLILFKPRDNTSQREFVNYIYAAICRLLWKYITFKFRSKAEHKFFQLMEAMGELGNSCSVLHNIYTTDIEPSQMNEMMTEMYAAMLAEKFAEFK